MNLLEVLVSADVLAAFVIVLGVMLCEPVLAYHMDRWFAGNHAFHWGWEHFFEPLIRASAIVAFVLMAYPTLFGVRVAPSVNELLVNTDGRLAGMVSLVFALSLLLPLSGFFHKHSGSIIPIQGVLATAMTFSWFADYLGATSATPWPGFRAALAIAAMAWIAHRVAIELGTAIGQTLDASYRTVGMPQLVAKALATLMQLPVVLYYGFILGTKIAI